MTATKERPILFSAPMVQAIQAGRKTQTRRIVKPTSSLAVGDVQKAEWVEKYANACGFTGCWSFLRENNYTGTILGRGWANNRSYIDTIRCPYGKPGDRLWVREAWGGNGYDVHGKAYPVSYKADVPDGFVNVRTQMAREGRVTPWRPSIHMPRWASRFTLEITDVRVERLNDISEADAEAEGVSDWWDRLVDSEVRRLRPRVLEFDMKYPIESGLISRKALFATLWESLHGKRSWAANPWLWVITFRRIDK